MNEYEFQGTFTYICNAKNKQEAREMFEQEMDSILYDYRVENTYGDDDDE